MKTWKLVSGILCIIIFIIIEVQSCAAGLINVVESNGGSSGSIGFICGLLMLTGGIVSIATRNMISNGGNISLIIIFGLTALFGFTGYGNYSDLVVWSFWALINVILAIVAFSKNR